jgi:hypothetical protein
LARQVSGPRAVKVTPAQWMRLFSEHSYCPREHRLVVWELAAFANEAGVWARPGVRLLADRVGLKKDTTISPALEWGRKNFWVRRTMRGNWRRKQADVYELVVPTRYAPPRIEPAQDEARSSADTIGGLTPKESAEFLRLWNEEQAWDYTKGLLPFSRAEFNRLRALQRKHSIWQVQHAQVPPSPPVHGGTVSKG